MCLLPARHPQGVRIFIYNIGVESSFLNPQKVVSLAGLQEGMKVADIAAAAGFFTRAAARVVGARGEVWATDSNRNLLPRIKNLSLGEGLHNVEVLHGSAEQAVGTGLPKGAFDFVIAANALWHTEQKEQFAAEAVRLLKRGGKVLLVDWSGSYGGLGPPEHHIVSAAAARRLFEQAGCKYLTEVPAGGYHFAVILIKIK